VITSPWSAARGRDPDTDVAIIDRHALGLSGHRGKASLAVDFTETVGLCQTLPGPNVGKASVVLGKRWFGWRASIVALVAVPFAWSLATLVRRLRLDPGGASDRHGHRGPRGLCPDARRRPSRAGEQLTPMLEVGRGRQRRPRVVCTTLATRSISPGARGIPLPV